MIYEAICNHCDKVHEYFASVQDRNNTPTCCGDSTSKVMLTPPQVGAMNWGIEKKFKMPDGTLITSGSEYKKYMKDNNKVPADEGAQEAKKVRKEQVKKMKQKLHKTVIDGYDKLASKKKAA